MNLSVAICTWNRCDLLRQTLERMASDLRIPAGVGWELLLVDNGSTDGTDRVLQAFRDRLPIRCLREPRQGLSHARNLAVLEARGDYIIWTDDDVLVDAGWLEEYCRAFHRHPEAAVFGGTVEPWFPEGRPPWLERAWAHVSSAYAVRDLGPAELPLSRERLPYGANMAFRAAEQKRFLYDTRLGHHGASRLGGEETLVIRSILAAGASGWWVPEARVRHFISRERQDPEYLRAFYLGRGLRLHADPELQRADRWGLAGWIAQALVGELGYRLGRLLKRPEMWALALRRSWTARGYLRGYVHRAGPAFLRPPDSSTPVGPAPGVSTKEP